MSTDFANRIIDETKNKWIKKIISTTPAITIKAKMSTVLFLFRVGNGNAWRSAVVANAKNVRSRNKGGKL